jgi:hypothetical protein
MEFLKPFSSAKVSKKILGDKKSILLDTLKKIIQGSDIPNSL